MSVRRYLIPVLCLLLALVSAPAVADFDAGIAAYERDDFTTAMSEWLPIVEAGDAEAQYRVGRLYSFGEGVEEDDAKTLYWYRLAADQDHPVATNNLGVYYRDGLGVSKDDLKSLQWFLKAADFGDAPAQYSVGKAYLDGRGTSEDYTQAFYSFHRSASQGDTFAQSMTAFCYVTGKGVSRDPVAGYMWGLLSMHESNWRTYVTHPYIWLQTTSEESKQAKALAQNWKPVLETP